jgi:hypothetical protein
MELDLVTESETHRARGVELRAALEEERERLKHRLGVVNGLLGRKPRSPKAATPKRTKKARITGIEAGEQA